MLKYNGLGLVELLVSLVILSILFFFCLPLGQNIYKKNQLELIKDDITAIVNFAKTLAITNEFPLALTPLPGTNDWSAGMLLFVDNKEHQYKNKTQLVHQWQWKNQGIRVSWRGLNSTEHLLFARDLQHSALSGHFIIEDFRGKSITLTLNRLGRVRNA